MRLSKERIGHMAGVLVAHLRKEGQLEVQGPEKALVEVLDHAITDELMVEDRLNVEVRGLLKAYEAEIEKGHVDYQKMFVMIKQKLVRERGVIL
ncbi:MAG: DUF507 family protein [Nitrospirae bacterium]|nr:DUF507 family protein [Nitrospirota bacterium]